MQLTKNFRLEEFEVSETARRRGLDNSVPLKLQPNIQRLAEKLQTVRDRLGKPIIITSGYRSPEVNSLVGGVPNSAHALALAVDFHCPGMSAEEVFQEIIDMGLPVDQLIQEFDSWVHLALSEGRGRQQCLRAVKNSAGKTVYRLVTSAEIERIQNRSTPIGVRLNNPGNLEWGSPWQGLVPKAESMYAEHGSEQQKRFCQFERPVDGIRAIARTLITYQDLRVAADGSRIDTVREVIERWAPSSENNVDVYTAQVRRALFGDSEAPLQYLDVHEHETLKPLVEAIIRHENGQGPLRTPNSWYEDAVIEEGLRMAGVKPRVREVGPVPVTPSTVGAVTAGAAGANELAAVLPAIKDAITSNQESLTSDSAISVIIGVILIGIAIYMAIDQVRKHKQGTL